MISDNSLDMTIYWLICICIYSILFCYINYCKYNFCGAIIILVASQSCILVCRTNTNSTNIRRNICVPSFIYTCTSIQLFHIAIQQAMYISHTSIMLIIIIFPYLFQTVASGKRCKIIPFCIYIWPHITIILYVLCICVLEIQDSILLHFTFYHHNKLL